MITLKRFFIYYTKNYQNFSTATWINIFTVWVVAFGMMMNSFFTLFLNKKGMPVQTIGLILACGGIGSMLGSYSSGIIASKVNPVRLAQIALLTFSFATICFPLVHTTLIFFFLTFAACFCGGFFRTANNLILFAHTEDVDHPRVMALNRVANNLGLACATTIGGFLASIQFSLFFIFSAIMSLLSALILFKFHALLTTCPTSKTLSSKALSGTKHSFHAFLTNHAYLLLCILFLLFNLLLCQIDMSYGLYLTQTYHISLRLFGLLFMINFLLIAFLEVPLMTYFKKANQVSLVLSGSFLVGMGLFILPFSHHYAIAMCSVLLWSMGEILATSPFLVLSLRLAHPRARSFYVGFFQSIYSLGLVLAPLLGGLIYPMQQGRVLWQSCGILSFFMIFGFLYLQYLIKKRSNNVTQLYS